MKPEQQKRFKELKSERTAWWRKTVLRSRSVGLKHFDTPAFCTMKDGSVIAVEVWVDDNNFRRVVPYRGTAATRVWPTLEGAYLSLLESAFREQEKLVDSLASVSEKIKAYDRALEAIERV